MTAARHHALALALLAACSLPSYTPVGATADAASSTTTSGTSSSTTSTGGPLPTTSPTTTAGGPIMGIWRGEYQFTDNNDGLFDHLFTDCATQQIWQLRGDFLPQYCGAAHESGLLLHVAGILHPDGGDGDSHAELEVTEVLADPCQVGTCAEPSDWSWCGPWPDVCGRYLGCDPWTQDCPEGQKCMPYSGDGDSSWESLKCVPVAPGPGVAGDPCIAEDGGVSGVDTCAKGHVCWDPDPDTGQGVCVQQCTGSPDAPVCPDCTSCNITSDGVLTLCLQRCSPLLQDCPGDEPCVPYPMNPDSFFCVLDASGREGQLFDPCEYANACDPGLWCAPPEHANECDPNAPGCCLPFCNLNLPTCPGAGQQCLSWSDPPPACGNDNLGTCRLPP